MTLPLPIVYISAPYRAPTAWQILANIRVAQEAALVVWKLGGVALCPHSNTGLFDGECPDEVWLAGDLELMRRCDAVLFVGAWQYSQGCAAEHQLATELGCPIFYHVIESDLHDWITDWKLAAKAVDG